MVPYNVGNYMFGLTSVPFSEYVLASALGIVHKVFFFAYFGSLARDVHDLSSSGTGPSLSTTIAIAIVSGLLYARERATPSKPHANPRVSPFLQASLSSV
jgi:uncharacterized membrane protein YdjX (TVP38/TMEM64 family)